MRTRLSRSWRRPAIAVALMLSLLSGCGSDDESPADATSTQSAADSDLPPSPVTDRLVKCLQDAGWDVKRSWEGGLEISGVPADQQSAYQAANDRCSESSGWNSASNLNDAQVKELYQQEVEAHGCYLKIGVDSAQPPSEQRYIETYQTKDQYYAFLPGFDSLNQAKMQAAVKECPPPTWFLNLTGL